MAEFGRKVSVGEGDHPEREARIAKLVQTGKYDRKAIRARMALESWAETQLAGLYQCPEEDVPVEIDLDEVIDRDAGERLDFVQNIVADCPNQADRAFYCKTLVKKCEDFLKEFPPKK